MLHPIVKDLKVKNEPDCAMKSNKKAENQADS